MTARRFRRRAATLADVTEGDVKPAIKKAFTDAGCLVIPTPVLRRSRGIEGAPPGWSDVVVLVPPGRWVAVEFKRPIGGKLTPAQVKMRDWFERNGFGEIEVVRTPAEAIRLVARVRSEKRPSRPPVAMVANGRMYR